MSNRRLALLPFGLLFIAQTLAATPEPHASTYEAPSHPPLLIRNLTVLTGTGEKLEGTDLLVQEGKLTGIGSGLRHENAETIDGLGRWATPGLIDIHSHLGNYPAPSVESTADGNEVTGPVTAHVWAEHSIWPQDPQFARALAGGVTSLQVLPGSANLIGGRTVTLKNVRGRSVYDMKFPGAPHGLKIACGENPKRVYGQRSQAPMTRMGNAAGYRKAWIEAEAYKRSWDRYHQALADREVLIKAREESREEDTVEEEPDDTISQAIAKKIDALIDRQTGGKEDKSLPEPPEPPTRDLGLETLAGVLEGEILVHNHCYRADEMVVMLNIAEEFGYSISTFHHAVESYKVADLLAREGVCSAVWADWWGFKLEAWDMVMENAALLHQAGACAIIHSDSSLDIQRLNQETAKAMVAGQRRGMDIDEADAIAWITSNPAKAMGIDEVTGSIELGKAADLVIWNGNPMSVYARAELVYIDGVLVYDRSAPSRRRLSDFDLDQTHLGRKE